MPKPKHIAIIGGASTWREAPFDDPDWTIWAIATTFNKVDPSKIDAWFDIHEPIAWERDTEGLAAFIEGKGDRQSPIYMRPELADQYPNALPFPRRLLLDAFGDEFFTSQIAWMMAKALLGGTGHIGIFGAEMVAEHEYGQQMTGVKHFMGVARVTGRKIILPNGSNLERPGKVYPDWGETPAYRHAAKELKRVTQEISVLDKQIAMLTQRRHSLAGSKEAYEHLVRNNWI